MTAMHTTTPSIVKTAYDDVEAVIKSLLKTADVSLSRHLQRPLHNGATFVTAANRLKNGQRDDGHFHTVAMTLITLDAAVSALTESGIDDRALRNSVAALKAVTTS